MMTPADVELVLDKLESMKILKKARATGDWYMVHCPFHGNGQEKKPSCGVLLRDQVKGGNVYHAGMFHCFACGTTLNMPQAIEQLLKERQISTSGTKWLEENVPGFVSSYDKGESLLPDEISRPFMDKFAVADLRLRAQFKQQYVTEEELAKYRFTIQYMYDRKLTDEIIAKYDVGFDMHHIPPGRSKELPCVTFPVRDIQGRTLFFCRRSVQGKYFNYPQDVVKPVYGIYELPKNAETVIICESCFNCLTAVAYGYNAVALLGTSNSYQMDQLRKLGAKEFVICLDGDEAGRKGTAKLKKALSETHLVWTMHMPPGKDANDCTKEEFDAIYAARD